MKYKMRYDLSHVDSLEALKREQRVVQKRLKDREEELRLKMYEIPAELAAAGANTLIPKFLRGKVTNAALNGGKKLINAFFVPDEHQQGGNMLTKTVKNRGVFSIIKKGIGLFKGK
jgi:hypothetical protein